MRTTASFASVSSIHRCFATALMLTGALCLSACGGSEKQEDNPSQAHTQTQQPSTSNQSSQNQAADEQDDDATLSAEERRRRRLGLGSATVEPDGEDPTFEEAPQNTTPESAEAKPDQPTKTEVVEATPPSKGEKASDLGTADDASTPVKEESSSNQPGTMDLKPVEEGSGEKLIESPEAQMPPIEDDHEAGFVTWVEAMGESYEGLSDASTKEDYADLAIAMLMARTHYQYLTAEAGDDWNEVMPQEVKDASSRFVKYSRAVMKNAHVDWKHPRVAPVKERSEKLADELAGME